MKKIILLLLLSAAFLFVCVSMGHCTVISRDSCQRVAVNFYHAQTGKYPAVQSSEEDTIGHGKVVGYVFNFAGGGFVKMKNQSTIKWLSGWGASGSYTFKNIPPWQDAITFSIQHDREIANAASYLNTNHTTSWARAFAPHPVMATVIKQVGPLLTTTWDQYPYYNLFCPKDATGQGVTGCVATAMAQIMKFWNYPTTGTGSYSYTDAPPNDSYNFGPQSCNFGTTTFQWSKMPNSVTGPSNDTAVATLMYACGVGVAMDYGSINEDGSGAFVIGAAPSAQAAYVSYFGYKSTIIALQPGSDTLTSYLQAIKRDIDSGHVCEIAGYDPSGGGHTWVCDGYQLMTDGSLLFHMNWGWSGQDNGWFSLNNLAVEGYNFSTSEQALINIVPNGNATPNPPPAPPAPPAACNPSDSLPPIYGKWTKGPFSSGFTATFRWNRQATDSVYELFIKIGSSWQVPQAWAKDTFVYLPNGFVYLGNKTNGQYEIFTICKGGGTATSPKYIYITPDTSGSNPPTPPAPCQPSVLNLGAQGISDTITCSTFSNDSIYSGTYQIGSAATIPFSSSSFKLIINAPYSTKVTIILNKTCKGGTTSSTSGSYTTPTAPPPTCAAPTGLASHPTVTQTLTWGGSATSFTVNYKLNSATSYTPIPNIIGNSITIPVITDSLYQWNAQGNCNGVLSTIVSGTFVGGK